MKDFAVNLIRLLLSFIILLFSEEYFYKFLSLFKINISKTFTSIVLYIIITIYSNNFNFKKIILKII